jgi:histidinol-phosphate aminotransferase
MDITRRHLLRRLGAGAAAAAAVPSLAEAARAADQHGAHAAPSAAIEHPVRLNRNENAYGPSPKVASAIADVGSRRANRYPDGLADALRRKIAGLHGVAPEQVVLGCGSTEIMRMAVEAFVSPRAKLVIAHPTFPFAADSARRAGADVAAVPLRKDYTLDVQAMLTAAAGAGLVYVCNPNNPTGSLTPRRDLEAFVSQLPAATRVLIDEAYHHYVAPSSDYASFIERPLGDPRVIVTRSFSKIYALAGLRVGYAIAAPQTAQALVANQLGDGLNAAAAAAAMAALDDPDYVRATAARNDDAKQEFFNQANARMLRAIDSHTNFVMMSVDRPAEEIAEALRQRDVLVVPCSAPFDTYVRVSLGAAAEMREFWRAWDHIPGHKMSM